MHSTRRKLLLPLAAASMISLPTSARALAFATRAAGGVRVRGGCAVLAAQTVRPSSSRHTARSSSWSSPRMELAVDSSPLMADATDVEPLAKTPANKLLYAPPKFTPIPYEYVDNVDPRVLRFADFLRERGRPRSQTHDTCHDTSWCLSPKSGCRA